MRIVRQRAGGEKPMRLQIGACILSSRGKSFWRLKIPQHSFAISFASELNDSTIDTERYDPFSGSTLFISDSAKTIITAFLSPSTADKDKKSE